MPEPERDSGPALSLEGVSKRYPGTLAVAGVDFTVHAGEICALVGENGAGKSTLVKIIAGAFDDYEGTIRINGKAVSLHSPAAAKSNGIQMIHQELSLAPPLSVAENILAGRLPVRAGLFLDERAMRNEAARWLAQVGLDTDPATLVADLSPHEAQLVEIARALGNMPCILVLDEPTSSLSRDETDRLFDILKRLRSRGLAMVYISHHLPDVFRIADRVTVLRDGRRVASERLEAVTPELLVNLMVGRDVGDLYPRRRGDHEEVRFRVRGATRRGFFREVSFDVRAGEIVGIGGLSGAGRTELARSLCGIDPLDTGSMELDGRDVTSRSFPAAVSRGVAYLTEDRKGDGLALRLPVGDNVLAAAARVYGRVALPWRSGGERRAASAASELDVQPPDLTRQTASLSGGNQQKALLAKWLAADPEVLFLDEPTRGVDVGAKVTIHEAIARLAEAGKCVVLISSDLPELAGLANRVLVMRRGRLTAELSGGQCTEEAILLAANGQEPAAKRERERPCTDDGPTEGAIRGPHPYRRERPLARARSWLVPLAVALAIAAAGRVASPHFLESDNLMTVLQAVALLGIVACGVCYVTYTGHYADLSVPSVMAFSGIVAVSALKFGLVAGLSGGLAVGVAVGLLNGLVIGCLRVNPIIWTLATGAGVGGFIRWAYSGTQVYPDAGQAAGQAFLHLYGTRVLGVVPMSVAVLLAMAAGSALLMGRTLFGYDARLTGSSYEAARLSGVRTSSVTTWAFVLSGAASAVGGMMLTSLNKVGAPYIGKGYDFLAVTAIVLGGMTLAGGRGSVPGVLAGVLIIGLMRNVMNLLGWGTFQQDIAQGLVFISVVGYAAMLLRRRGQDDA